LSSRPERKAKWRDLLLKALALSVRSDPKSCPDTKSNVVGVGNFLIFRISVI
jgi:hypothetical protein